MTSQNNIKRALITGATGFAGGHLANRLVQDGWEVHVIIRPLSKVDSLQKNIFHHCHDGTTTQMISIIKHIKPDVVFHLASTVISHHQSNDIEPLIQSNILFGTQLVEAMVTNEVYYLVNTGTSWQHYQNESYNPVCLYAATKQAYEDILTYYIKISPLKVVNLKLFDTYGTNDNRLKLIPLLLETVKNNRPIAMSPGEQFIDLVHIDDVINAFVLAAERLLNDQGEQWEEYSVSSGKQLTLKELVKLFETVIGQELSIKWGGRPYRSREVLVPWNQGKILPGWNPKIPLEEGIKNIVANNR